jgi:hypothetical protein
MVEFGTKEFEDQFDASLLSMTEGIEKLKQSGDGTPAKIKKLEAKISKMLRHRGLQ